MTAAIYLVDDEEAIRRSLGLMLQLAGYKVSAFATGPEFLEVVGTQPPGCILLDIRMPEMTGLEVQQELGRRGNAMPVVMMTGHGDLGTAVAALRAGADDVIEKPFERAKILEAVELCGLRIADPIAWRVKLRESTACLAALSPGELAVLEAFSGGLSNQAAADALGRDLAAIEAARAALISRLGVASLADAVRLYHLARRTG